MRGVGKSIGSLKVIVIIEKRNGGSRRSGEKWDIYIWKENG